MVCTLGVLALVFIPLSVHAQTFAYLVRSIVDFLAFLAPFLVAIMVLVFFWGLVKFIARSGSEEGRREGKQVMVWGLIGITIAVSIWGIVAFLIRDIFGLPLVIPQVRNGDLEDATDSAIYGSDF